MSSEDDGDDVLSRLPRTRPARRSARREPRPDDDAGAPAAPAKRAPRRTPPPPPQPVAKPSSPPPPVAGPIEPPSAGEIAHTAAQAAVDLGRVGLVVGRSALKAVVSRLPRP